MRISKRQLRRIIRETVQQRPARRRSRALREAAIAMAQPELEQILQQHLLWLDTDGREGVQANLWSANLRGADLRGVELRRTILWNADLRRVDLRGADLREADLRDAILWKADLYRAYLQGADLREADLRGADLWEADLRDADLRGAELDASIRYSRSLENARFSASALPLLELHPEWDVMQRTVRIEGM